MKLQDLSKYERCWRKDTIEVVKGKGIKDLLSDVDIEIRSK